MKKRVIILLAALLCLVLVFAACNKKQPEELPVDAEVVLVKDGECQFVIIGDESANYISGFLTNVEKTIGTKPAVYKTLEEAPADKVKMVIGNPETFGLTDFLPEVPYFGYMIKASHGNLYVLGYSTSTLGEATGFLRLRVDEFYKDNNLLDSYESKIGSTKDGKFNLKFTKKLSEEPDAFYYDVISATEV